jgi:hypothetical protein
MNTASFRRKIVYLVCIAVLLIPLYSLGQPMSERGGEVTNQGGKLSQLRLRHDIGQASLGEIEPASTSMRLATVGLRGVAATILWYKAQDYYKMKYWDRFAATLDQIALLQPHFVSVWDHQAHALTYNTSVEFDDYRDRFEWVKRGIYYLVKGTRYNKRQPALQYNLGIYNGQKIGVADERAQYRELYRNDDEFHDFLQESGVDIRNASGVEGKPDHWLVGGLWFLRAYGLVEAGAPTRKSLLHFYSEAPKTTLRYSEAIASEGYFDSTAKFAWQRASEEWRDYGNRDIPHTSGLLIRLNGLEDKNRAFDEAREAFNEITKDELKAFEDSVREKLTDAQIAAMMVDRSERNREQYELAKAAEDMLTISPMVLAAKVPPERRVEAVELAKALERAKRERDFIEDYRNQSNYLYWAVRADSEQSDLTLAARQLLYDAVEFVNQGQLDQAELRYEAAWKGWSEVFRRFPIMLKEEIADEIEREVFRYRQAFDIELDDAFPLAEFLAFREAYAGGGLEWELDAVLQRWSQQQAMMTEEEREAFARELTAALRRMREMAAEDEVAPDLPVPDEFRPRPAPKTAEESTAEAAARAAESGDAGDAGDDGPREESPTGAEAGQP